MKIKTSDLREAVVRHFDIANNGLEFTAPLSRVILLNRGDTYVNVLNPGEIAPIYYRVPNTTNYCGSLDDYFGSKVDLVQGETKDGEAWLLEDTDFRHIFGKDEVSVREIENYVIFSDDFFHNRRDIIEQRLRSDKMSFRTRKKLVRIIDADSVKQGEMDSFFAERGIQKVKR